MSLFLRILCSRKTEHRDTSKLQSRHTRNRFKKKALTLCDKREGAILIFTKESGKILTHWHNLNCTWLRRGFGGVENKNTGSHFRLC